MRSIPGRPIALALFLVVAALYAASHMDQGIDTWISLAGGRDVAAHGVRDQDPFSFNSRPPASADGAAGRLWNWLSPSGWINQNWLTHVLLHGVRQAGGLDALVWWKVLNYLLVAAVLVAAARRLGAGSLAAVVVTAAALAVARDYLSIRAQDVSNLLAALLVLVLALVQKRGARWAWTLVPLFAAWANAHGGYVFGLVVVGIAGVATWFEEHRGDHGRVAGGRTVQTLALAGAAALAACVVTSPYRLANLTHPLVITLSADAPLWRVVREWRSLFTNPLSSPFPFLAFAGAAALAFMVAEIAGAGRSRRPSGYAAPAVVLSVFALAVASARFVPLACITAAPFVAVWLHRAATVSWSSSARTFAYRRPLALAGELAIWGVAVASAAAFSARAGATFLGPWPQDFKRTGLFDRLTHAHQRPWGPCEFLAANGVTGRMWNFWDEGGFLAACQHPDERSGAPPVQVFIDGRAQAAYDIDALSSYLDLLNGPGRSAVPGAGGAGVTDLETLRAWTAGRLHELGVGIAVISAARQGTALARAAATLPGWQLAYIDGEHTVMASGADAAGRRLIAAIESGAARYPDVATQRLTAAFRLLPPASEASELRAIELAREAHALRPSSLALLCATRAGHSQAARRAARRFCLEVAEDFTAGFERYRGASGLSLRIEAAVTALEYLGAEAQAAGDAATMRWAGSWLDRCRAEQDRIGKSVLW